MVRNRYGLVNTLGLYVNTLEYTELLNRLIFDRVYGSETLSSLLCTLGNTKSYDIGLKSSENQCIVGIANAVLLICSQI